MDRKYAHNWTLFQVMKVGRDFIKGKLVLYNLLEDCNHGFTTHSKVVQRVYKGTKPIGIYSKFYSHVCRTCYRDLKWNINI